MKNVRPLQFSKFSDLTYGNLTAVECGKDISFAVKRVYYIYDVPDKTRRGFHSHYNLHQALICVKGSVKILTKTPYEEQIYELNEANKGLYIGPMVWREMYDFSSDAVLLVLASELYDVSDYIRDYAKYEKLAVEYFVKEG